MARLFPEPIEYVEVKTFVIKDTFASYDRYWNKDTNKWVGLLNATHYTKEEADGIQQLPENGVVLKYDEVIGIK